jgi:hypothetical protein
MKIGTVESLKVTCIDYSGPASGDSTYVYTQHQASSIWIITHNLHKYVSVSVVDTGKSEIEGDVQYIDENTIQISFSAPFSGQAFCN